ncbi:hypothetical protein [Microbacterium thalli]|uniref:hypothetical protein n=1 Tax=Microbacterium thalli TaxID=3027921 RepID=UPI00236586EE|nr:hypothetical protein [Microbacterium thalli]MDD7930096.1 hypothetical protein [Microbacterium thalli]
MPAASVGAVLSTETAHADGRALHHTTGRAYCGRKTKNTEKDWNRVTCVDCHAARRADEEAR